VITESQAAWLNQKFEAATAAVLACAEDGTAANALAVLETHQAFRSVLVRLIDHTPAPLIPLGVSL